MQDFQVIDWTKYAYYLNANTSLESLERIGVIKFRAPQVGEVKRKRGRPKKVTTKK